MGRRSDWKKDRAWTACDMNCRSICPVKSQRQRRKMLRDKLYLMQRKRIHTIIVCKNLGLIVGKE